MATKKAAAKSTKAIQKKQPDVQNELVQTLETADDAFKKMSKILAQDLTPGTLAMSFSLMKDWSSVLTDLLNNAKERIKKTVLEKGEVTTEKGSRTLLMEGWQFEVRPHNAGTDPRKLEALLRAKGLDPAVAMAPTVVYKLDTEKLALAVASKTLTVDEVANCKADESWALQTPKKIVNNKAMLLEE